MKLVQASTLNALMLGNFDTTITVGKLLEEGDTGIGTYTGLNGEAIFMNGVAYNATADGEVVEMSDEDGVAFGTVCHFDSSVPMISIKKAIDLEAIKKGIEPLNKNAFYMLKTQEMEFSNVHVRSCYPSVKPFPTLSEVANKQKEFNYHDIKGYIIGVYCPKFVNGINLPGWHFHFISSDLTKGGHVLGLNCNYFCYQTNKLDEFDMYIPTNDEFTHLNLCEDLSEKTAKVEG